MSLRNLKKLNGPDKLLEAGSSSGEEYEPLCTKVDVKGFASMSLADSGTDKEESPDTSESDVPQASVQEKKKKSRKNKNARRRARPHEDEVLDSVRAVNAILGAPSISARYNTNSNGDLLQFKQDIRTVDIKLLNVDNELKKKFGPDSETERPRLRRRVPNLRRIQKQVIIDRELTQKAVGLSMLAMHRVNGTYEYIFRHNKVYRAAHISFLKATDHRFIDPMFALFGETYKHVEAQLEIADFFFLKEEYTIANNLLEKTISMMENSFHPTFRLANPKSRLPYNYIENRPFHVAVLKYVHLLTNRACHRTALELAKVLMNLDPTDPLAVIFIIDVLAIRAKEYEWLINAIEYWRDERSANELFNMKYSYALAHYYLSKDDGDLMKASKLLEGAILSFPMVALFLMKLGNVPDIDTLGHRNLFTRATKPDIRMRELFLLYAHFAHGWWKDAMDWLVQIVTETADMCDSFLEMQGKADLAQKRTSNVIRIVPVEVQRHLCVIKPMSSLLVDGAVPIVPLTRMSDPLPDVETTVDRCGYMDYSTHYLANPAQPYADLDALPDYFRNNLLDGIARALEECIFDSSFFEDSDDDDDVELE